MTVNAEDGSSGFALVASDGAARFVIPNGTTIPARGHFLGVNSAGYSLGAYPSGNGATATGDAAYTEDVPENAGIALFGTSDPANFNSGWRLDAAGSDEEGDALYKGGRGLPRALLQPDGKQLHAQALLRARDLHGAAAGH